MQIAGLQKNSTLDFPGCLAAVIFTAGCSYRCFYCHNRHILDKPQLLDEAEVGAFLKKRAGLIDGVVFSGGEPTMQRDLARWMDMAKKLSYRIKLDTNGSNPDVLSDLLEAKLVDYVAMDYKAPFEGYESICGVSSAGVRKSLDILISSGVDYELRTTVVPQLSEKELLYMAKAVPELSLWALQLYRQQDGDDAFLNGLLPYTPMRIKELAGCVSVIQPNVTARC
ncbi:MAG: anaerobic ribonucleoside-triphosphate reductase activating protein [Clostridia bacterium]